MPIMLKQTTCWDEFFNPAEKSEYCFDSKNKQWIYNRYKLHINIHPDHFSRVKNEIDAILNNAVDDGVIPGYKVLARIVGYNVTRVQNIPYAIYLPNKLDDARRNKIIKMCTQIESLLCREKVAYGNVDQLSVADVLLPGHFTFRQTAIKETAPYEYIDAYDESKALLLKKLAIESPLFNVLSQELQKYNDINQLVLSGPLSTSLLLAKSLFASCIGVSDDKIDSEQKIKRDMPAKQIMF
jgi:hypothetical protein